VATEYGVCTWIFGGEPLATTAERLARLGYNGVELFGDLSGLRPNDVARVMQEHGLRVISLTPDNVDILHPNPTVRSQGIDYYLRLLDFAHALGAIMCCHGAVGRIRPISSYEEERTLYLDAVRQIGRRAESLGVDVAMEVLNRYEAHFLLTSAEAARFVDEVGSSCVGILLDAYHMNIEENDLPGAILTAGPRLKLFHAADSNRKGVGRGHTDFLACFRTLRHIGYDGPVIMECVAPGPDPFAPLKGDNPIGWIETYLDESLRLMKLYEATA
jgi:D-psicose/D-tagatose/L-ribulose 3-epimerase